MRLVTIHDQNGNISSVAAIPPNSAPVILPMKAGEHITELEVPDIAPDLQDSKVLDRIADLVKNYRVDVESTVAELVKKT